MKRKLEGQALTPNDNIFGTLSPDVAGAIVSHSSVRDILNLMYSSITTHNLFKPSLITGLWTNFDLNGPGPVGEPEPARAPANLLFAPF